MSTAQQVIDDLSLFTHCRYITKDADNTWSAWQNIPTISTGHEYWHAKGDWILIKPGLITDEVNWQDSGLESDATQADIESLEAMSAQEVIDTLTLLTRCRFISKDKSNLYTIWQNKPTILSNSQGWFAPGEYVYIRQGIIKDNIKWQDSGMETDVQV